MKNALLMLLLTFCTSCNCAVPVRAPPPIAHVSSPSSPSPPPSPYSPSPPYSPSSNPVKQTAEDVTCFNLLYKWLDNQFIKVLCPYLLPKFIITIAVWIILFLDASLVAWLLRFIVHSTVSKERYEQLLQHEYALSAIVLFYFLSFGISYFLAEIYLLLYACLLCVLVARGEPF
jgi:hypothetical protein